MTTVVPIKQKAPAAAGDSPGLESLSSFLKSFQAAQPPEFLEEPQPLVPPGGLPGRIGQQFMTPWGVPPGRGLFGFLMGRGGPPGRGPFGRR